MAIKVTGGGDLSNKLHGMADRAGRVPDTLGAYVVQEIIDRTQNGVDMNGVRFLPYKHPEVRTKGGRQSSHVDLNWSGAMLASMTHKASDNQVVIFFRSAIENAKAHGHHFGSRFLPQRRFFGIDPVLKQNIIERLKRWVNG